mgnify:CR=1 FL=1
MPGAGLAYRISKAVSRAEDLRHVGRVADDIPFPCATPCFVAGTPVAAVADDIPIDALQQGDLVLGSLDEAVTAPLPVDVHADAPRTWAPVWTWALAEAACPDLATPAARWLDPRTGTWDASSGATAFACGALWQRAADGVVEHLPAATWELERATAPWSASPGPLRTSDLALDLHDGRLVLLADAGDHPVAVDGVVLRHRALGWVDTGTTLHPVTATMRRVADRLVRLQVRDAERGTVHTLTGSPEHPMFLVELDDYLPLGQVQVGDALVDQLGRRVEVVGTEADGAPFTVFNLEVQGAHNYFVLADGSLVGVLVHNGCGGGSKGARKAPNNATYQLRNADGTFKQTSGGGEVVSGGTSPGRRLSFPEQQRVHTEGKILDATSDNTQPGDILTIQGREPVCSMCSGAMKKAANDRQIRITYEDATGSKFVADGR